MNYLKEINAFYNQLEVNPLSGSANSLWHALLHINNKAGWKKEFTVAASVLCSKAGLSDGTFKRARNELKQKGYIIHKARGSNLSAVYEMISVQTIMDYSAFRNDSPLVKQKKKQKEVVQVVGPNLHSFYEQNIGTVTPFIAEMMKEWCEELSEELVMEALKIAVRQNKLFFQYIDGILRQWKQKGVRKIAEVKEGVESHSKESLRDKNKRIFDKLRDKGDPWITVPRTES
ncbi:DnaD domain-containing protein [Halobacillus naozhouensis]|uniref:DnaD domain protein n=1 Tax=Halobacillus naozhouensis TaxID=554880 RepID=A0ABY8IZQ3_9BACI|nr:DnaD domain protein [Halobacillus naozhouensis]WFT75550.1 DnaD domain protein [Halobacillus naozhouensis]